MKHESALCTGHCVHAGSPRLISLFGLQLSSQVVVEGGELSVRNCTFSDSSADLGGALLLTAGTLMVDMTTFVGCRARRGGAVHVSGGSAIFSSCTFEDCRASEALGGCTWPPSLLPPLRTRRRRS